MQPISITPSAEKGSVSITVGENKLSLTTEEVDALLLRLAEARPMLLPPPSLEPEPRLPRQLVVQRPAFWVHPEHQQGGVLLHISHPALGWMTWHLQPDSCLQMMEAIRMWRVPPVLKPPAQNPG